MSESAARGTRKIRPWNFMEALVAPFVATYKRKKLILLGLAFALFILLAFLGNVEQVLRDLHEPGGERASTATLANALFAGPSEGHVRGVLDAWSVTADKQEAELGRILGIYAVVDLLLVVVYALFAGMLLVILRKELGPGDETSADERSREDLSPYRRPVAIAIGALGFLLAVDVVECALIFLTALVHENRSWDAFLADAFWLVFRLKAVLVLVVLVPGVVAVLTFVAKRPERRKGIWPAIAVARGQLLVLVILFAGLFVSDQAVDVLRRWYEDWQDAFFAILMLVWLAVFMLVSTVGLLDTAGDRRSGSASEGSFVAVGLMMFGVAAVSWSLFGAWIGLATLAGVLLGIGLLSLLVESVPSSGSGRELRHAQRWLPMTLGLLVLFVPILALVGAAAGPLVLGDFRFLLLLGFAAILVVAGMALVLWNEMFVGRWRRRGSRRGFFVLTVLLVAVVSVSLVVDPWGTSEKVGAVAFLVAFLVGLALILFALIRRVEETRPPDIVAIARFRCTPVILLIVVWVAVTSAVDRETTYHDVRQRDATAAAQSVHPGLPPSEAFEAWKDREPEPETARPLLFVAAAGGGIRAAYWTATVLTCVLEGQVPPASAASEACAAGDVLADGRGADSLFAASGISGGSLGLASYVTHLTSDTDNPEWPKERLSDDYASIVVGWGLFVDLPSALIRRTGGSDRAEMLERAFERSWLDEEDVRDPGSFLLGGRASTEESPLARGLLHEWETQRRKQQGPMPLLMLNGTKVQEGCRLNVSVLDTSVEPPKERSADEPPVEDCLSLQLFERPALTDERRKWSLASSEDLTTYLCPDRDVRLSTAVMLSARFPWALPSGRLTRCEEGRPPDDDAQPANIVDGGYFDTSGASPIVELWGALAREVTEANRNGACIVPYFLQIDTGYADPVKRGDLSPSELLVPPVTARRARDAREHNARQAAALLFSGVPETAAAGAEDPVLEVENRYAHIYPRAHAGVRAPLGWSLSQVAREELAGQLDGNDAEIRKVRRWLADSRPCKTR